MEDVEGSFAVNAIVLASAIGPVIVVLIICWVFFGAARRNDEREALAKPRQPPLDS
jgi:hypothetical protein